MALNKVILMGNLVETPQLNQTASGTYVTNFRLAVQRRFKSEGQPDTDFITIVCWRSTAEFVAKHFTKGRSILLCGQLQTRTWTDNEGVKRYATEVIAEEVSFCDKKPEGQKDALQTLAETVDIEEFANVPDDDDLPF